MDLKAFQDLWTDFLAFLDRTVQWLTYIFGGTEEWNPTDPDSDFNKDIFEGMTE